MTAFYCHKALNCQLIRLSGKETYWEQRSIILKYLPGNAFKILDLKFQKNNQKVFILR